MRVYKIGRAPNSDIYFDHAQVSRQHADLICGDDGTYRLSDHSSYGTTINGRPVSHTTIPVKYGDNVIFADVAQLDWSKVEQSKSWSFSRIWVKQSGNAVNGMAIAGFVLAFLFSLLGAIFSYIGFVRAKERSDRNGYGLSLAGLIISGVFILITILSIVLGNIQHILSSIYWL